MLSNCDLVSNVSPLLIFCRYQMKCKSVSNVSPRYTSPQHAQMFAHLKQQAEIKVPRRHVELYDTIMGCLGYTSPNGGINQNNNWCHIPDAQKVAAK